MAGAIYPGEREFGDAIVKKKGFFEGLFGSGKRDEEPPSQDQTEMIQGIQELADTTVKEVMVPRIDTVFLPHVLTLKELMDQMVQAGHSRYPVYRQTIDNVIGILYLKDVFRYLHERSESAGPDEVIDLGVLCRPAYFVPDSKRLDKLLADFKHRKVHIAVALDEYGGVAGIICLEDVLEVIVGDIQDEFDNETDDIVPLGEGVWLCDARVPIEDLNERIGLDLPHEDFDTLGGFVFDLFGKIPVRFEKVQHGGWEFVVQSMQGHKIRSIKIVRRGDADA